MKPPYQLTPTILQQIVEISQYLGEIKATHLGPQSPELRKQNRIKTIQASLEIEGNTLSLDQVTAIVDNKRVLGPATDILEVQNAIRAYESIEKLDCTSTVSFLKAHQNLMDGLVKDPGKWRSEAVGIVAGNQVKHLAPPAKLVPQLMENLFQYLHTDSDPCLIKSCVFHYEMEFIHPFMDGNGRLGRLWQTKILSQEYPVFLYLPLESLIKENQQAYYEILGRCDRAGQSTEFIEFMLGLISQLLAGIVGEPRLNNLNKSDRLYIAQQKFGTRNFQRKEYQTLFKEISTASASRDLAHGVELGLLSRTGDKRMAEYTFVSPSIPTPSH